MIDNRQADELKRLIELALTNSYNIGFGYAMYGRNDFSSKPKQALLAAIDSLTQQPAELTDNEIEAVLEKAHARFSMYSADVKNIHASRAVIAAHKEKQVKV